MKTIPRTVIVVAIIAMLLLACKFLSQRLPSAQGGSDPANPITIKISVDQNALATSVISSTGGSLTATAADGSRFTLTLPAGALLSDEQITLIPITTVDGLPLSGGFVTGVQLNPDGLQLLEPAILTIVIPQPAPTGDLQLVGFAFHGEGDEFYLSSGAVKGSTITMRVTHFSGRGIGKGTRADIQNQQKKHPPSSPADDADQLLVPLVPADEPVSLIPAYLNEWWQKKGLEAKLNAASTDENLLEPALAEFLQFLDKVKLNKLEDEFGFQIEAGWGFLGVGVVHAVDKAYTACVNQNDVAQAGNIWRWIDWAERLPQIKDAIGPIALAKMQEKAQKCLTFELEFDSVINMKITEAYSVDAHLHAVVPIKIQKDGMTLAGQAPLEIISYKPYLSDDQGSGCKIEFSTPAASQFQVVLGLNNPNLRVGRDPNRLDPVLQYSLGKLVESMSIVCLGFSSPTTWGIRGGYQFLHAAEMGNSSPGGITIEDPIEARIWNGGHGQWTKTYKRSAVDLQGVGTISENTTLILKHTPGK